MTTTQAQPALRGDLDDVDLLEIMEMLCSGGRTGTIEIDGAVVGRIELYEGQIASVRSPTMTPLRDMVDPLRAIPIETWYEASQTRDPIIALAEAGVVDLTDLRPSIVEAYTNSLLVLSLPAPGTFTFEPAIVEDRPCVAVEGQGVLDLTRARRLEWQELASRIPSTSLVPTFINDGWGDAEEVTVSVDAWRLVGHIDGVRDIGAVLVAAKMTPMNALHALDELVERGLLELRG